FAPVCRCRNVCPPSKSKCRRLRSGIICCSSSPHRSGGYVGENHRNRGRPGPAAYAGGAGRPRTGLGRGGRLGGGRSSPGAGGGGGVIRRVHVGPVWPECCTR